MTQLLHDFSELTPADFSTYFFIYTNGIESSLGITPHSNRVTRPLHGISVYNLSTKNIARVQVNGWEITEPHQEEWSIPCGFSRTSRIPTLTLPIQIRWQYKGEENWRQSDITSIPSVPVTPQGIMTDNIWYDIYLEKNSQQMQLVLHGLTLWTDGELGYSGEKWESGVRPNETCNNQ